MVSCYRTIGGNYLRSKFMAFGCFYRRVFLLQIKWLSPKNPLCFTYGELNQKIKISGNVLKIESSEKPHLE